VTNDTNAIDPIIAELRARRGRMSALAKKLRISVAAVGLWKQVPPKHAVKVGKFLGRHPHFIRPDIYPRPRKPKTSRKPASNVVQGDQASQATQADLAKE
jgi:hypothetical protein